MKRINLKRWLVIGLLSGVVLSFQNCGKALQGSAKNIVESNSQSVVDQPVINEFLVSSASITLGGSTQLSWNVTGATSLTLTGFGDVTNQSMQVVSPQATTSYTLSASVGSVTVSQTRTVTVNSPPVLGVGPTYYFSDCQAGAAVGCVAGDNANSGTSVNSPKRDLGGMDISALPLGTTLLFARGGVWHFSNGIQIENANVTPAAPLVFDAYGTGNVPVLKMTVAQTLFNFGSYQSTLNDGGYTFRNLKIDGVSVGQWAFYLGDYVTNMTIENVEITGFEIGIHSQLGVTNANIRNNNINTNSFHGILGEFSNSTIEGNLIANNNMDGGGFEHGIYLGGHATNLRVINNIFRRNSSPNGVCNGGNLTVHGVYDNLLIEGNTIEQTSATGGCYGISITAAYSYAESFTNVIVRNNVISNLGNCAICVSSAPGARIENNRIYNSQAQFQIGIHVPAIAPGPGDAADSNQIIQNNLVCFEAPTAGSGAVMTTGANSTVANNTYVTGAAATTGVCAR